MANNIVIDRDHLLAIMIMSTVLGVLANIIWNKYKQQ